MFKDRGATMKNDDIEKLLINFPIFRQLDDKEIAKILEISITREWKKGSHIFFQDEPLENVYFISTGKIKIYKNDLNGKEQIVNILKRGEMFPHIGFFRRGGYPANAEALTDSTLVVVPISLFEQVLIDYPSLSIKVFKVLGEKIVDLQERLEEQVLNNTHEQIIRLLVRLGKKHGQYFEDGTITLKGEFTNKDLANMIGTTRETVSRTLTRLKKEGKIATDNKGNLTFHPDKLLDDII